MIKAFQNLTLKKQLLLIILPIVAVIICANSYVYYKKASNKLHVREFEKKENIKDGVIQFIDNYDLSLKLIESNLTDRFKFLFSEILTNHRTGLHNSNLDSLQKVLLMNSEMEDIYIISKHGEIINTTNPTDLGFNLSKLGETYKTFLANIWKNKNLRIERVANEHATNTPRIYAYQAINNNYILEIGMKYPNVDTIVSNFEAKLKTLTKRYSNIRSVDLFGATEVLRAKNKGGKIDSAYKQFAINCYKNKRDTSIFAENDGIIKTDFVHIDMRDAKYFNGYILQIVSDDSLSAKLIKTQTNWFLIVLLSSLLIMFILLSFLTKIISNPIQNLTKDVSTMANSLELKEINIKGSFETVRLSDSFNFLAKRINQSQDSLEAIIEERTNELIKKNNALNTAITQKETLLKEIHHRVKNNLQIIASLLSLQSKNIKSDIAKNAFKNSISQIQAMGLLHEKLYENSTFIYVKSQKYLKDLIKILKDTIQDNITITLLDDNITLNSSQAISIGLIINEFIANTIKHACEDLQLNGNVIIELKENENNINFSLRNDGKHLPENFTVHNENTLGIAIISAFVDKLNGTFTYQNIELGIELGIVFPKEVIFEGE